MAAVRVSPASIDDLDWEGFENWVEDRAIKSGDWDVSKTPRSGDGGVDTLLRHRRRRATTAMVQAKHTTDRSRLIGETAVRELLRAVERFDMVNPQLVAITNACGFTDGATKLALENEVKLIDRNRLGLWPNHVLG